MAVYAIENNAPYQSTLTEYLDPIPVAITEQAGIDESLSIRKIQEECTE